MAFSSLRRQPTPLESLYSGGHRANRRQRAIGVATRDEQKSREDPFRPLFPPGSVNVCQVAIFWTSLRGKGPFLDKHKLRAFGTRLSRQCETSSEQHARACRSAFARTSGETQTVLRICAVATVFSRPHACSSSISLRMVEAPHCCNAELPI